MNIVDQGTPESESTMRALPISAAWRDVHVRLVGSSQIELAESFDLSWRRAHHLRVPRRSRRYRRASFANEQESIRFFDSGPGPRNSRAARIFRRLFNTGRNNVLLSMAYFIPTGRVLRALLRARRRGVRIEVVLPGESDVKLVQWATQHLYAKLLRHGLSIYERKQRMLHSKVMVVDDEWTVIGSCNLDPRSLRINLEFLAVIRSRTLASKITDLCKHEIANSRQVTCESCERRNWWQRLRDRMAYSLRNWL